MSSAVNKSSTRFRPKATGRNAGQGSNRRSSSVRASFSVPQSTLRDDESTAGDGPETAHPLLRSHEVFEESNEEAIMDEDTPVPELKRARTRASNVTDEGPIMQQKVSGTAPLKRRAQLEVTVASRQPETRGPESPTGSSAQPEPDWTSSTSSRAQSAIPGPVMPISDADGSGISAEGESQTSAQQPQLRSRLNLERPGTRSSRRIAAQQDPERVLAGDPEIRDLSSEQQDPQARVNAKMPISQPAENIRSKNEPASDGASPDTGSESVDEPMEELPAKTREWKMTENNEIILEPSDIPKLGIGERVPLSVTDERPTVINPETFTMKMLCKDIPSGAANKEFLELENQRITKKKYRADLLFAKRMMRGTYQPRTRDRREHLEQVYTEYLRQREHEQSITEDQKATFANLVSRPQAAPQLTLDESGTFQLDAESTRHDRHELNRADNNDDNHRTEAEDRDKAMVNSASFSTKQRSERWTEQETEQFYQALTVWGTDFNLIAGLLPGRSRHQVKTKFKYEEKRNDAKVQLHLLARRRIRLEDYADLSGKKIEDPQSLQEEMEKLRADHEAMMKQEELNRDKARAEDEHKRALAETKRSGRSGVKRER